MKLFVGLFEQVLVFFWNLVCVWQLVMGMDYLMIQGL